MGESRLVAASNANGSCLPRLRARLPHAPKSRQRIARFILESPADAQGLSAEALAEACDTSASTVIRFCQDLGYVGYRQFQLDLAASIAQSDPITLDQFPSGTSAEAIIESVFLCNQQSLRETARILDKDVLIRVARTVRRARRTFFLGVGGSALIAREAVYRLTSLGLTAIAVEDPYHQTFVTGNVDARDTVIAISHTGQTASVVEATQEARARGAQTVALTNYPDSPLAKAAELCLTTAFREHRISAAVSSSRTAQACIVDSLYFVLGHLSGHDAKGLADAAEQRVRRMLRWRVSDRTTSKQGES